MSYGKPSAQGTGPTRVVPDGYQTEPMRPGDIDAVAQVHVASFGTATSFLASMGVPFLRHYFRAFLDDPQGCALVCRERQGGPVVGFVCGSESVANHYRVFLQRRALPSLPAIVGRAARDPAMAKAIAARVWRVARLMAKRGVGSKPRSATAPATSALPPASLMTIGVDPAHRRRGIGELLVRAFMDELTRRGVEQVKLGVRDENATARSLYERLGWRPVEMERPADGRVGWMYVRDLTAESGTSADQPGQASNQEQVRGHEQEKEAEWATPR